MNNRSALKQVGTDIACHLACQGLKEKSCDQQVLRMGNSRNDYQRLPQQISTKYMKK